MNKTLTYADEEFQIELEIHPATILDGLNKNALVGQALQAAEPDQHRQTAHIVLYPVAMGATVQKRLVINGIQQEMSFEIFLKLPEKFIMTWLEAAYEVNPHWAPVPVESPDELLKKV